jgi:predicted DCC family thiol-disulfide oxidoreductase YuxK
MQTIETHVIFNDTCPVCRFEINHYSKIAGRDGLPVRFIGIDGDLPAGLTADDAARRLHVWDGKQLVSGVPAFILLWRGMRGYRHLARLIDLPVIRTLASLAYDHVAAPLLYRAHLRRVARSHLT